MMKLVEKKYLLPFVVVTVLFALWGVANDITNPMVAAFQTLMELSATKASLIQFAFYGGYATMAIPAALFIRRFSYKSGILLGLALYAVGAFLFIPAAARESFAFFCLSLYILTFGLAFLETTANPFILSLGSKESATRRLNMAQAFNPMGSLAGMAVASLLVLPNLYSDRRDAAGNIIFPTLSEADKAVIRLHDLAVIRDPYVILGCVVLVMLVIIALVVKVDSVECSVESSSKSVKFKSSKVQDEKLSTSNPQLSTTLNSQHSTLNTIRRLISNRVYREGVVAQMFYVAAQIMVWTFIIHYADNLGINKATAQNYNIVAMCLFLCGRFVSTWLMKYVEVRRLLTIFGLLAAVCTLGAILIVGKEGLLCLVGISLFMSLMFPTIYGIALEKVCVEDVSLGAAFLVMAIVGGALMPPLQGMIIDCGTIVGHPAVNVSYCLPLICFLVVAAYGVRACSTKVNLKNLAEYETLLSDTHSR